MGGPVDLADRTRSTIRIGKTRDSSYGVNTEGAIFRHGKMRAHPGERENTTNIYQQSFGGEDPTAHFISGRIRDITIRPRIAYNVREELLALTAEDYTSAGSVDGPRCQASHLNVALDG